MSRLRRRIPTFHDIGESSTGSLRPGTVLAINLGKNKTSSADSSEDFITGIKTFGPYADVLVINVSSPNTPGLRYVVHSSWTLYLHSTRNMHSGLQNRELLESLLKDVVETRNKLPASLRVVSSRRPRLVLKIAPDLEESQLTEMAEVIQNSDIDGIIVSNTTIARPSTLNDSVFLFLGIYTRCPFILRVCRKQRGSWRSVW